MPNRFIIEDDDTYFVPSDSQCKTCIYRNKKYSEGYMNGACEKYPGKKEDHSDLKPNKILFFNQKCSFYKEEK